MGVKKGDRVAVSLSNIAEHVVLTYAIFKLGAIMVPLNPTFDAFQLSSALSQLGVEVLVIGAITDLAYKPGRGQSNLKLLSKLIPNLTGSSVESPTVPTLKSVVLVDNTPSHPKVAIPPLQDLRSLTPYVELFYSSGPRSITPESPLEPSETINIQFTSGTTSFPKAAMLTHTNILNNGYLIAARMGLKPQDRIVCPPPLFHCFGCVLGLQATATTGASILFPSPAFDPAATLRMAAALDATGLYGVPTMFNDELELLFNPAFVSTIPKPPATQGNNSTGLFRNLTKGIAAGSTVPRPLMRRLRENLGLQELVIGYGMTETSPISCMTSPLDPEDKRTGTVGKVMPHTAVKIVDRNDRSKIVARGERGELASSGYLLMRGYYSSSSAKDLVWEEGEHGEGKRQWMYSGDEARMDEEGFVEITGRIKDLIIRGGENIHPLEIESVLMTHPLIREVSVVAVPDERYGEAVGAVIAVHDGVRTTGGHYIGTTDIKGVEKGGGGKEKGVLEEEGVRAWVRESLSNHLAPKHIFWTDDFPKTASGKIKKDTLRQLVKGPLNIDT